MPKALRPLIYIFFYIYSAAGAAADVTRYLTVNRAAVAARINHHELTLAVNVGTCSSCLAWVDASPVTAQYKVASGECVFTVPETGVNITVTAVNHTTGGNGACRKARVKFDRDWAYSFTWDDSRDSVLPTAKPIFDTYGFKAGMALNSGLMGTPSYMTWTDLDQLYAAGWGIQNHSQDHLDITAGNAASQIGATRSAIEARYPGYYNAYFIYPYNNIQAWATVKALGYIHAAEAETGENYIDTWPVSSNPAASNTGFGAADTDAPWLLRRHQAYRDTPVGTWNAWLDSAANDARPRWLIAFSHQCLVSPGFYDCTPAQLNSHLSYLYNTYGPGGDNSVWMAPSDEVYNYLQVREACTCTLNATPPTPSPTATSSRTATPSSSPTSQVTLTNTLQVTASHTLLASATQTSISTLTPSPQASETQTSLATSTSTLQVTATSTRVSTGTQTTPPSATQTILPSHTETLIVTATASNSLTVSLSSSPTVTLTVNPSSSVTSTATMTILASPSPSVLPTSWPLPDGFDAVVWPNPNPSFLALNLPQAVALLEVRIYSTANQLVRSQSSGPHAAGRSQLALEIQGLANGTYYVKAQAQWSSGGASPVVISKLLLAL